MAEQKVVAVVGVDTVVSLIEAAADEQEDRKYRTICLRLVSLEFPKLIIVEF